MTRLRLPLATAAAILLALAAPGSARAASFTLHTCTLPDGSAAPLTGWAYSDEEAASFTSDAEGDHCADGTSGGNARGFGALIRTIPGGPQAGGGQQFAGWSYQAPGDTLIRGGLIRWSGRLSGSSGEGEYEAEASARLSAPGPGGGPDPLILRRYKERDGGDPFAWGGGQAGYRDSRLVESLPIDGDVRHRRLTLETGCLASSVPGTNCESELYVRRVTLVLSDDGAPSGTATGELLADGPQGGTRTVRAEAADGGSGVRSVRLAVDGRVLVERPLDSAPASCRDADPRNADPHEYAGGAAPCPSSGTADLALDTRQVPDGERVVRVSALDAAGNEVTLAQRSILVANAPRGPAGTPNSRPGVPSCFVGPAGQLFNPLGMPSGSVPNGSPATTEAVASASLIVRRGRRIRGLARRTVAFSTRPELRGRLLTRTGVPVAGAAIFLLVTPEGGAPTLCGTPVTTSAAGRWSLRLPARGTSRTVTAVYFPSSSSDAAVVSPRAALRVRSASALAVTPRRVDPSGRVRFAGRLLGPGARGNVIGTLEARELGTRRWRTFARVRSDAAGRFRASYRFRRARRVSFAFRLVVPRQPGRPYATGRSRSVVVRVR